MRISVIGNGLAGAIASKTLRELDPTADIDVFSEEKYLYYPRPNLIEFLAGRISQNIWWCPFGGPYRKMGYRTFGYAD